MQSFILRFASLWHHCLYIFLEASSFRFLPNETRRFVSLPHTPATTPTRCIEPRATMTKFSSPPPSPHPMSLIDAAMYHTLAAARLSPGTDAANLSRPADDLSMSDHMPVGAHGVRQLPPPRSTRGLRAKLCEVITQALEEVVEDGYESDAGCRASGATLSRNARRFDRRDDDQRPTN